MSEPFVKDAFAGVDKEAARTTVLRAGEMALTLTATDGDYPHSLRQTARAMMGLDRLLRALAKEVAPKDRLEPVITRVTVLDQKLQIVVRVQPAPRRTRRKAAS